MSPEKIVQCIEGEPEISTVRVNPGNRKEDFPISVSDNSIACANNLFYTSEKITGNNSEDSVPGEGSIYYDIRFFAYVPKDLSTQKNRVKIILNLEAQKSFYPGYQIVTRGIFYGCRMISAQLDTEFEIPDYDSLKKVYSIWICMNAPAYIGNAISRYPLTKEDIIAGIPDRPTAYDKLTVVLICLNESMPKGNEFLELLNVLLSPALGIADKKRILSEQFHINIDRNLEGEVNLMCNYSDYVEELGIQKGYEQGSYAKLKEQVEKKLLKKLSIETIADALEETPARIQQIIDELSAEKTS